jgi:hypothetical protein
MKLVRYFCTLVLFVSAAPADAAPVTLSFSSNTYVPGEDIVFDIQLPTITNLATYNVDVVIEGVGAIAGNEFRVVNDKVVPATTTYVFGSSARFALAVNTASINQVIVTTTDFVDAGTDVVVGVNDAIATVRVDTLPSFRGDLVFSVDADQLILDQFDPVGFAFEPVAEFGAIQTATRVTSPIRITAVPEPGSCLALSLIAGGWIGARRRRLT